MPTTSTNVTATVDTYLAAYGEPDRSRREQLIAQAWDEQGRLVDPPACGEGRQGINGLAEAVQQQFPGHRFRRVSLVDAHHDVLRFAWELVAPGGEVALTGTDFGQLGPDGRLRQITGFFGALSDERADQVAS